MEQEKYYYYHKEAAEEEATTNLLKFTYIILGFVQLNSRPLIIKFERTGRLSHRFHTSPWNHYNLHNNFFQRTKENEEVESSSRRRRRLKL